MKNQTTFADYSQSETYIPGKNCFSWGAMVGGALVAVGLSFLLNLLCAGIGLSAFTTDAEGLAAIGIGGYIGMLIGVIIVMFLSGWVAGYLAKSHCHRACTGALYGFISWCLSLLLLIIFASYIGKFMTDNLYHMADVANHSGTTAALMSNNTQNASSQLQNNNQTAMTANQANTNQNSIANTAETAANATGGIMLGMFILFLVGALASMLGGYFAAKSCRKHCGEEHTHINLNNQRM